MDKRMGLIQLSAGEVIVGTGWLPPRPDLRDYTPDQPEIVQLAKKAGIPEAGEPKLPTKMDLRPWCTPIEDQGQIGSCTANAAAGIVEYFQNRAFKKFFHASRLFIYKTTRNLMNSHGDTGAYLRNTMGALAICGVAPEKYWPYTDKDPAFDKEPPSFIYAVAEDFQAIKYFCHDPLGKNVALPAALISAKKYLAAGIPSIFGFYGFPSFEKTDVKGGIPYPGPQEQAQWGHAVAAMGYDDKIKIKNLASGQETTGALLIRNSWGAQWGDQGYGWLPYAYVLNRLAEDFWSLLSLEWVDTQAFGLEV